MGGSRHPGRVKILEILKRNSSNLPSKISQPISVVLNIQGILQIPKSEQHCLRDTSRRSRILILSCNHSPHTRHHQHSPRRVVQAFSSFAIKYSTNAPQCPSSTSTSTRRAFLVLCGDQKEEQFDADAGSQFRPRAVRLPPIKTFRKRCPTR
jgi:hypothetical protein